ncbi:MBL fold metallo-hydrolase [Paenibacillus physcomitrellae]|uniref:Membrane protein n=1 Tax=Paenibacillus physcomitrellae TaxID=1619311 RepID=A0ABQ1GPE0_9BACL|nr:MBL fold metallo-hydrolase [Paenibacillus physcomitrellae]GGA47547.1 membrane protein [Paenibacillus physcomitrellae]
MLTAAIILILIVLIAAAVYGFIRIYPPFGVPVDRSRISRFEQSEHYRQGKFQNRIPTQSIDSSIRSFYSLFADHLKNNPKRRPPHELPVLNPNLGSLTAAETDSVTWLGHSSVLLKLGGKNLLLDPMLGMHSSPLPGFGAKRFKSSSQIEVKDLPRLDAVFLSHDHFDHLDYSTIQQLSGKVGRYFVPLGVGSRLVRFGVERGLIQEFDWWGEVEWQGIRAVCTPARHFSGRALFDKDATLWCSWVLLDPKTRVYFSGDSGYDEHFKRIGDLYGPFDLTLIECGQYDPRWEQIHMMPEQTVQAHKDLRGRRLLPIHWAGFALAMHGWMEPVERVSEDSERRGVELLVPRIGETVSLKEEALLPRDKWWRTV